MISTNMVCIRRVINIKMSARPPLASQLYAERSVDPYTPYIWIQLNYCFHFAFFICSFYACASYYTLSVFCMPPHSVRATSNGNGFSFIRNLCDYGHTYDIRSVEIYSSREFDFHFVSFRMQIFLNKNSETNFKVFMSDRVPCLSVSTQQ